MAATATPDIEIQRGYDTRRGVSKRLLAQRFVAAVDAARTLEALDEYDADRPVAQYALRQALVDLSACAGALASALPAPTVHMEPPKRKRSRRH